MTNEIAKLILEKAKTQAELDDAIEVALQLGMTAEEIRDYLDYLEMLGVSKAAQESEDETVELDQDVDKEDT